MKFGIEIEFEGDTSAVIRELNAEGLSTRQNMHGYIGHSDTEWVVKTDGSVSRGGELVSPPLNFDNDEQRAQVDRAVQCLQRAGARPSQATGIHVHIESAGMTPRQISGVARLFTRYEDLLYRIGSSGWQTIRSAARSYAKPLTEQQKKGLANARTDEALQRAYYGTTDTYYRSGHGNSARYAGLNLHSHWYRGTIEFRIFNGSINSERIQAYIAICAAFVRDAKNDKLRSIGRGAHTLGDMKNGRADEEKHFFNFISVMRYHAGMSLADYRRVKKIWADSVPQEW